MSTKNEFDSCNCESCQNARLDNKRQEQNKRAEKSRDKKRKMGLIPAEYWCTAVQHQKIRDMLSD